MRRFKKFLIIILAIPLLNILLITVCNRWIEGYWWKYSHGADFKDFLEFDGNLKVKSILIQKNGKTEKIIFLFLLDYMILADKDLTNWTYYVRKGKKYDLDNTGIIKQEPAVITITPGDEKMLDSLMKNRK
jgi:hypothetical protein